jgi:hypothetical protein
MLECGASATLRSPQSWRRNWQHVAPFFAYPESVRRIIYTTDENVCAGVLFLGCASDLVAKRGASAASAAGRPIRSLPD